VTQAMPAAERPKAPAPVATAAEAEKLRAHFVDVMDALVGMLQQETELIRAGKLGEASTLADPKAELSRLYIADTLRLRANQAQIAKVAPGLFEELRHRHDEFRALLQINLTVLATAHAVSEGIVRGVSGELARKASPQTYGATGRANAPNPRAAQPLAISKSL
jgi:hypothetical protein